MTDLQPRVYGPYYSPNDVPDTLTSPPGRLVVIQRDIVDSRAPRTKPFFVMVEPNDMWYLVADRRALPDRRVLAPRRQSDRDLDEVENKFLALRSKEIAERLRLARTREWTMLVLGYFLGAVTTGFLYVASR